MIGCAGIMLLKQPLDNLWFEQSLLSQPTFPQKFLYQRSEESFKPKGSGNEEASFFAVHYFRREDVPEGSFEQILSFSIPYFHLIGQTENELHQVPIQKRRPDLKGMHHRTAVHFDQNVIKEILAGEEVEDPVDRLSGGITLIESFGFGIEVFYP